MKESQKIYTGILIEAGKKGLYKPLILQLQKDFDRANVSASFSDKLCAEELFSTLHEKIYQLIMERFSDYLTVLYVVDVPERDFKKIILTNVVEVAREVSLLILKREWQKVQMKQNHGF
jgi:hypothetical protein